MAEYIEREKVEDELLSWAVCLNHPEHLLKEDALCVIDSIPAADVVEVVRCCECKHWIAVNGHIPHMECGVFCGCYGRGYPTAADDFCSYGERRYNNNKEAKK